MPGAEKRRLALSEGEETGLDASTASNKANVPKEPRKKEPKKDPKRGTKRSPEEMEEETDKSVWLDTNVILFGLKRRSRSTHPPPFQYALTRA